MKYVIIGNSAGAIGTIEGIRSVDKIGKITVISDEKYHTYSRPLISYLIQGKTTLEKMKYRNDDFYKENNVKAVLGKKVVKIDAENKFVETDDGQKFDYDKLMIATGSKPFVPPIENLDKVKEKTTFMSLDDAKYLQSVISKDKKVLIMGAGLIGLKCAECLVGKVKEITVVDLADHILPSILGKEEADVVEITLTDKGIKFLLGVSVKSFDKNEAILSDGTKEQFDVLVVAVGVRPNVNLAKEIGAEVNRGIIIDEKCATTVPDVYACGDCSETVDETTNERKIIAILPNAYYQGETAGKNMAGLNATFNKSIAMNSIGFFGKHIISAGSYIGKEICVNNDDGIRKFYVKDGYLKGFKLIGKVDRAGIYTSIVREKIPLEKIDFESIKQEPALICFSKEARENILTKEV